MGSIQTESKESIAQKDRNPKKIVIQKGSNVNVEWRWMKIKYRT
jgi:hypothetical protein